MYDKIHYKLKKKKKKKLTPYMNLYSLCSLVDFHHSYKGSLFNNY